MAYLTLSKQNEIDAKVDQILLDTGLSYPKNGLLEITKALGINVYSSDLPDFENKKVKGIIKWPEENDADGRPTIYLNKDLSETTKMFTLAHEIGHFILHPNERKLRIDLFDYSQDTKESMEETAANYFAASLLVPKDKLGTLLKLTDDLDKIAEYFRVSRPVVENRIKWLQTN